VTTSRRRKAKSTGQDIAPSGQGNSTETRTYPFSAVEGAGVESAGGDARQAAQKIRRFEIFDEIGRGGHGVVFRANDRVLKRLVALKLPRPEVLHSKEMRRRFVSEAQVVAALDHPNIIRVYDAGFESTVCYIAQELCDGPSLATWLKEQTTPIRPDVAASIILGLARGLEHAHQRNVLHRDLKPANVLLKPRTDNLDHDGSELRDDPSTTAISKLFPYTPKLGDFGICKAFDADPEATGTRTGLVLGTAAYMPPEQAVGVASELRPQSDVYSLGAILYELLTGHPPFQGVTSSEVLKQVLVDRPASTRAARRDVPAALDAICLKCLEKSTWLRYATAAEMADDLRRFLLGQPVRAPRKSFLKSVVKAIPLPRRPVQIAIALSGWIVVAVYLGLYFGGPLGRPSSFPIFAGGDSELALTTDVRSAFNLWHENAERLRDNPNVGDEMTAFLARHIPRPGEVDRRGFDWHYAWRLCHPIESVGTLSQLASFQAHQQDAYFVAFCRDGSRFATAGRDKTARVWDAKTLKSICVCSGHTDDVNCVDFSPDQRSLVTASDDHSVKLWDAATGKELFTFVGHASEVVAARFSPTGDTIVSGDHLGALKLWDLASKRVVKTVPAHKKRIQSLSWGMRGHQLASIGNDNLVRLWEMPDLILRSERETTENECASFSPVTSLVACGGLGTIDIIDVHSDGRYATFSDHISQIESVTFSPDGRQLASCDGRGELRIWDVTSRQGWTAAPIRYRTDENGQRLGVGLWCVAYSPDGSRLITTGRDGIVDVWDTSVTPQRTMIVKCRSGESTRPLAFSPGGKRVAIAKRTANPADDHFQIYDVSSARPKLVRDLRGVSGCAACFSRDGKQLVVGALEKVEIFDPRTGEGQLTIPLSAGSAASAVAFDGRGSLVVLENSSKLASIHLVDPSTGTKLRTFSDSLFATAGVHDNGFSVCSDGALAAVTPRNSSQVSVCELSTGRLLPERLARRGVTGSIQFAPIGDLLAIASAGGVELWDARAGKEQAFLSGLGRVVGPLAFSPDGRLLIVVSQEQRAVHVWDVQRHKPLFTLPLPAEDGSRLAHWHLAVAPDGHQIACTITDTEGNGGVYLFSGLPSDVAETANPSLALEEAAPKGP
jgi:eukaryotic-like serine/threonine-protein kinase